MLSEGACHRPHLWRSMHSRQASWAARNTDYNVSTQQLQKCAWLIPDVFKIQTAFRNLVGASEGDKRDGVPILPSQYLPKLLYFSFYYLTGMQEWSLLLFEEQATFLPSLQKCTKPVVEHTHHPSSWSPSNSPVSLQHGGSSVSAALEEPLWTNPTEQRDTSTKTTVRANTHPRTALCRSCSEPFSRIE